MDRTIEVKAEIEQKSLECKASGDGAKKMNEDSNKIPKSDVSSQSSQGKGPTKEPSDEADDKCDDSYDSKTVVAKKSSKKKALQEEDDVEEDTQHKNSQKGSKSKSSAKEEKANVTKKENPSDSSCKSKKRKANSDEESDAKDKETDEEESETPKKKSRKKVQEEEEDDDDEEELKTGLLKQPVVLEEGPSKDKKLDIPEGLGEKLRDNHHVKFQLSRTLSDDPRPLHRLPFQQAGSNDKVKESSVSMKGSRDSESGESSNKEPLKKEKTEPTKRWRRQQDQVDTFVSFIMTTSEGEGKSIAEVTATLDAAVPDCRNANSIWGRLAEINLGNDFATRKQLYAAWNRKTARSKSIKEQVLIKVGDLKRSAAHALLPSSNGVQDFDEEADVL